METKTYLLKHEYDFQTRKMKNVEGATITIQFRVMDNCSMIEIIGKKSLTGFEEFKHQILCHKEQMIKILPNKNDQIEKVKEPVNKDRVLIDQNIGVQFEEEKTEHYILGLHGLLKNMIVDMNEYFGYRDILIFMVVQFVLTFNIYLTIVLNRKGR